MSFVVSLHTTLANEVSLLNRAYSRLRSAKKRVYLDKHVQSNVVCVTIKYYGIKKIIIIMLENNFSCTRVLCSARTSLCHEIWWVLLLIYYVDYFNVQKCFFLFLSLSLLEASKMLRIYNFRPDRANFENLQAKFKQKQNKIKHSHRSYCFRIRAVTWKKKFQLLLPTDQASEGERDTQRQTRIQWRTENNK